MPKSGLFFVTAELQKVLDNLPADEPRSRLEPFRLFILRWRRERRSYERIRQILRDECQVKVSVSTLFKFVQRCSRPRKPDPAAEITPERVEPPAIRPKLSHEERVSKRDATRAAFVKPAPEEKPGYRFEFDESKPITNKHYEGKRNGSSTANS